jgi:hypothetical protein
MNRPEGAQMHVETRLEVSGDELDAVELLPQRDTMSVIIVAPTTIVVNQTAVAVGVVAGSHGAAVSVNAFNNTHI